MNFKKVSKNKEVEFIHHLSFLKIVKYLKSLIESYAQYTLVTLLIF